MTTAPMSLPDRLPKLGNLAPHGPAEHARIRPGDIPLEVHANAAHHPRAVPRSLSPTAVASVVSLRPSRGGVPIENPATIAARPEQRPERPTNERPAA